ncbi:MAG: hypothetical protein LAQ30_17690 [Acidobacteriia bacterium]|nr:hypothetical protein [Terriglobia bacterium]
MKDSVEIVRCPNCGSRDVRPSYPAGPRDALMMALGFTPLRCRSCQRRFYRRALRKPGDDAEDSRGASESGSSR